MNARIGCIVVFLAACLTVGSTVEARFIRPELEKIPVNRLVKNLEAQAAKERKNAGTRYNLARVHAMAYALKNSFCDILKKREPGDGPFFGFTPAAVPFKSVPTKDKDALAEAKVHLDKAIATYKLVLNDQPSNLAAQIGLAWCIEQGGDKKAAVKAYREIVEKGWEKDHKLKFGPLGGNFITKEAAGYLIPLLDKANDGAEIDALKARVAILNKLPRPVTPIAVPLRDGLSARDLEDRKASVLFDADGTALPRRWTWLTKDAAWLVHDPKQTGKISSGLQLFGNVTFWCFWENGYDALSSLDDNGDGMLTGAELKGLALWHDANGNGFSEPGEVRPLSAYGIVGISCRSITDSQHPDRIAYSPRGVLYRDGSARPTFDLILRQR